MIYIRKAEVSDISTLNSLLRQVLDVHHKGRSDLFKAGSKKYTDEELTDLLLDENRPVFVEEQDGEVVGYIFCVIKQEDSQVLTPIKTLYVDDLCVDKNRRGQGIGKRLYNYALEFAKTQGCYNLTLNVWSCNKDALSFYQKLGLQPQKIHMETILK